MDFYRGNEWSFLEGRERFSVRGSYRFLVENGVKALMAELSASNTNIMGKDNTERIFVNRKD